MNPNSRAYLPNIFLSNNCSVCYFWLIIASVTAEQWILGNTSERDELSALNSPLGNLFLACFTSGSFLFIFIGFITHGIFSLALPSAPSRHQVICLHSCLASAVGASFEGCAPDAEPEQQLIASFPSSLDVC